MLFSSKYYFFYLKNVLSLDNGLYFLTQHVRHERIPKMLSIYCGTILSYSGPNSLYIMG